MTPLSGWQYEVPLDESEIDLSTIVTRLNRIRAGARARLANSELTRAFLMTALGMMEEQFGGKTKAKLDDDPIPLAFLSRPRLVRRTQVEYPELDPTEAKFRDRWGGHQDFLGDFISYALAVRHLRVWQTSTVWAEELVDPEADFAAAVHKFAYHGIRLLVDLPAYRLRLLAVASADTATAGSIVQQSYEYTSRSMLGLFEQWVERFRFKLRPGVDAERFIILLLAVAEGLGERLLAGLDDSVLDTELETSLLGTATLALFTGLADPGDGLTVEEAANARIRELAEAPEPTDSAARTAPRESAPTVS
ncbi:hypothetical protein SPF06_19185 [Sinomonas sp. JGH33]|uniref:Uncharacterized protein n=1 Tax=Sinomonas terricola TaxID=3110330 RepID=A0ABU5TBP0_9MICC|nr:hypothetical protein [Sinomonas sp. JGH33]MEA5456851.1 hypothetical protein [Sinomonas sp. JGH33]